MAEQVLAAINTPQCEWNKLIKIEKALKRATLLNYMRYSKIIKPIGRIIDGNGVVFKLIDLIGSEFG